MIDLGLAQSELNMITSVFSADASIQKAVIFGSRAKGNFKKYSDIDIAVFGAENDISTKKILLTLDELPLIYKFDVVSYKGLNNDELREHIDRAGITIYEK